MLHRRVELLFFPAGNFQRAILFARIMPAIDGFSLCDQKEWSVKQLYRDGKAASSRRTPKRLHRKRTPARDQLFFNSAKSFNTWSLCSAGLTPVYTFTTSPSGLMMNVLRAASFWPL
jgi:hypothetical protein